MASLLIILPVILGVIALAIKNKLINRFILIATPITYLVVTLLLLTGYSFSLMPDWISIYFSYDPIGKFFLAVMSVVFCATSVYSLSYLRHHNFSKYDESKYVSISIIFVAAMSGVILSTHLALMWVFVEATTLSSALLIYLNKTKSSLEATWKYIFICSVGISLAFVGIIILSIGAKSIDSLFFSELYQKAAEINPLWLKIAFAFMFVGFGTKVGVAPIHAWLPDAHSEAPSPVSALLSATLLNSAFVGLMRIQEIMIKSGNEKFSNFLFIITGFLSLFISAVFMLKVKNYKRMLAYSSIENMGILFICLGLGKPGYFALMVHVIAHSFSKASLFLTSGNILSIYKTKESDHVRDLVKKESVTGWLWILSILSISGVPPFPSFISKFLLISAMFSVGLGWLSIPFMILMVIIFYGMGGTAFKMSFKNSLSKEQKIRRLDLTSYIPQFVLLTFLLIIGFWLPDSLLNLINSIIGF